MLQLICKISHCTLWLHYLFFWLWLIVVYNLSMTYVYCCAIVLLSCYGVVELWKIVLNGDLKCPSYSNHVICSEWKQYPYTRSIGNQHTFLFKSWLEKSNLRKKALSLLYHVDYFWVIIACGTYFSSIEEMENIGSC